MLNTRTPPYEEMRLNSLDILIIEDERSQREMLHGFLSKEGHRVFQAKNGEEGLKALANQHVDLVLVDYKMPGKSGLEVIKEAKALNPKVDMVMITAYGTMEGAVEAMKAGALDYITKPIDLEELLLLIQRIGERRHLIRENEILKEKLQEKWVGKGDIVFKSQRMEELLNLAGRVAPSKATCLIQGESGTGKELFARLIHSLSPRSKGPLVVVNCGAIPEHLVESELFGHEKGAFTGATSRRIGRFEEADKGTLFLDEIGELPKSVQVRLLRFLQEGEFQRVGSNQVLYSDVRVISATNRDLEEEVRKGNFREDLFFRLNVVILKIPPLRERKEDIPPLTEHFVEKYSREYHRPISGITEEAMDLLLKYDYPGNVRELENIIQRAIVISRSGYITVEDLPFKTPLPHHAKKPTSLKEKVEALEKEEIKQAMDMAKGNQSKAAFILGMSERMLRYKLKKYRLK